jgi:hypothetical protein
VAGRRDEVAGVALGRLYQGRECVGSVLRAREPSLVRMEDEVVGRAQVGE